jgi:transglutaminase-like putative cysteine protease
MPSRRLCPPILILAAGPLQGPSRGLAPESPPMFLDIAVHLDYRFSQQTDVLIQIEAAPLPEQILHDPAIRLTPVLDFARVAGEDGIGERIWLGVDGPLVCDYTARVELIRPRHILSDLTAVEPRHLPGETVHYLMASRYCPSDEFQSFVHAEFEDLKGGVLVAAIRDWISSHISYVIGSSHAGTTALDTFVQRQGICRDFAHVMITLARAAGIPARMVSVLAPDVDPPDFHAVAQVYLDGGWVIVDPTGMSVPEETAIIGVGRDAADIAFLTSFGPAELIEQSVSVTRAN